MTWCEFWEAKENPTYYYIEADWNNAIKILKDKFGLDINHGEHYIHCEECKTYTLATGHNRGLRTILVPKINGLYQNDDPIVRRHTWLEISEYVPAGYFAKGGENQQSTEEFEKRKDVIIVRK